MSDFAARQVEWILSGLESDALPIVIGKHLEWILFESLELKLNNEVTGDYASLLFDEFLKAAPEHAIEWLGAMVRSHGEEPVEGSLMTMIYRAAVKGQMHKGGVEGIDAADLANAILPLVTSGDQKTRADILTLLLRPRDISMLPDEYKERLSGGRDQMPALAPEVAKRHILKLIREDRLSFEVKCDLLWSLYHVGMDDGRYRAFLERTVDDEGLDEDRRAQAQRKLGILAQQERHQQAAP